MIFGLIGLLIVVAIIGVLVKKQLNAVTQPPNSTPSKANASAIPANIAEQSKQMQSQMKEQLDAAMEAAAAARLKLEASESK